MKTLEQTKKGNVHTGIRSGVLIFLVLASVSQPLQAKPEANGWVLPRTPYPFAAMKTHEQGKLIITCTTDASGQVVKASAVPANAKDKLPELIKTVVQWALAHWHGPPNSTKETSLDFRLH